jgi:hypothetical protein
VRAPPCSYPDVSGTADDAYGFVKAIGKFKATQRTDGISTSDLILRLVKDYNDYVLRNLGRGYTRHDMNVSFVRVRARAARRARWTAREGPSGVLTPRAILSSLFQEKRLRLRGKLQAVGQKVRRFWADHSEAPLQLSQFADKFANRFLRAMKARPLAVCSATPA